MHLLLQASSGSDSEAPVKKLKTTPLAHSHVHKRRKSKARTKLSPLLENACSPIAKPDHTHPPSPLVTTVTSTPSQSDMSPPHTQAPSTSGSVIGQLRPPITAESAQPLPVVPAPNSTTHFSTPHHSHLTKNFLSQAQQHQSQSWHPQQSMAGVFPMLQSPIPNQTLLSPQSTLVNPAALSYPFSPIVTAFGGFVPMQSYGAPPVCIPGLLPGMSFYNPQTRAQSVYPTNLSTSVNFVGNTSLVAPKYGKWSESMCSSLQTNLNQRSQLQSVPPWFIFSDKRADSKVRKIHYYITRSGAPFIQKGSSAHWYL